MLHVDPPTLPLDPALWGQPGAFAWWYADAVDEHGNGFVVIAAWGLPFLPGERAARQAGVAVPPAARPSLNVVLYRAWQPVFYTLYTPEPERCAWDDESWRFGDSTLSLQRDLHVGSRRLTRLTIHLDLPVPGDTRRLTGNLVLTGPTLRDAPPAGTTPRGPHTWTPLAGPARAVVALRLGIESFFAYDGPAYLDRNGSTQPMESLGLDRWTWGRAVCGDDLWIWYLSWPTGPADEPLFLLGRAGRRGHWHVERLATADVSVSPPRRTWLGMPWWSDIRVRGSLGTLHVRSEAPVDSGPFYLRLPVRVRVNDRAPSPGWSEVCVPDRIDGALLRPLVRMCVHPQAGPRSMWLPLFVGPRADRTRRLMRAWTGQV